MSTDRQNDFFIIGRFEQAMLCSRNRISCLTVLNHIVGSVMPTSAPSYFSSLFAPVTSSGLTLDGLKAFLTCRKARKEESLQLQGMCKGSAIVREPPPQPVKSPELVARLHKLQRLEMMRGGTRRWCMT